MPKIQARGADDMDSILNDMTGSFSVVPLGVAASRLFAAIVLAGMIGFEREWQSKPAGFRTHILVGVAACLFVIIGQELGDLTFGSEDQQRFDPLRLIEAVTAGVAFLAAGLIFTANGKVWNVTTGASIWLAGAVGMACGAGKVLLAALAAVIVMVVLSVVGWIERKSDLGD